MRSPRSDHVLEEELYVQSETGRTRHGGGGATTAPAATTATSAAPASAPASAAAACTVGVSWNNFQQPRWAAHDKPNLKKVIEAGGGTYIRADANLVSEQ